MVRVLIKFDVFDDGGGVEEEEEEEEGGGGSGWSVGEDIDAYLPGCDCDLDGFEFVAMTGFISTVSFGLGFNPSSMKFLNFSLLGSVASSLNAFSSPSKSRNNLHAGPGLPGVPCSAFWLTVMGRAGL